MDIYAVASRAAPSPFAGLVWGTVIAFQLLLVVSYAVIADAQLGLFHLYPFVWINLAVWAVWRTTPPRASRRTKTIAGILSGAYFLVLAYFGGLIQEGHAYHAHHEFTPEQAEFVYGADLVLHLPPGYGPALTYSSATITSALSPYLLVGFLALTYLLYVTILDASSDASLGLVGLFSCVGCSFPLIAALVSGGATTAVTSMIYAQAYALSTVAFAATLLFLTWRPFEAANVRQTLVRVGVGLVGVTALVHLALGLSGLLGAVVDGLTQATLARSIAYLLFAAFVGGALTSYHTGRMSRLYGLTILTALAAVAFVLYFEWHLVGTLESALPLEVVGLEHDQAHEHGDSHDHDSVLVQASEHLRADPAAMVAKSAEFMAVIVLGSVAVQEWVDRLA